MTSPGTRFSADLAEVVFGEDIDPRRQAGEIEVVKRFRAWIETVDRSRIHQLCGEIDRDLIPALSPRTMLEIGRAIEAKTPEVIQNMPNLCVHLKHLERVNQLAQVFMPVNLANLMRALKEEGSR